MAVCVSCGHELGIGRFCTNCGQPVGEEPRSARYPLFADEVDERPAPPPPAPPPTPNPATAPVPRPEELAPDPTQHHLHAPTPRPWWPWVAVVLALGLVVALVVVALDLAGGDEESGSDDPSSAGPGRAGNPLHGASVMVPATAPPNQDTAGNRTTYAAANLLDRDPATCWRMPGDGAGEELTVTLRRATHLTSVGMINGYAKTAEDGTDWYAGNRRILKVEWVFDDGTTVPQELAETRRMQSVDVDVTTKTIVIRLVTVSQPGTGPARRDFTAISELSLTGGR